MPWKNPATWAQGSTLSAKQMRQLFDITNNSFPDDGDKLEAEIRLKSSNGDYGEAIRNEIFFKLEISCDWIDITERHNEASVNFELEGTICARLWVPLSSRFYLDRFHEIRNAVLNHAACAMMDLAEETE